MTAYTFDESIVSDLHKDARGFRPSQSWWNSWNSQDDAGKQATWNALLGELEDTMSEDRRREEKAVSDFEGRIELLMQIGARDRNTAIRWIVDSLDLSDFDKMYGGDYICFLMGLPYRMKETFDQILS